LGVKGVNHTHWAGRSKSFFIHHKFLSVSKKDLCKAFLKFRALFLEMQKMFGLQCQNSKFLKFQFEVFNILPQSPISPTFVIHTQA